MQFVLFTDNLQSFPVAQLCAEAKKLGFDGLDLTLRPGGHVEPENAEAGLAEAKRAADEAEDDRSDGHHRRHRHQQRAEQVFASARITGRGGSSSVTGVTNRSAR